MPETGPLFYLIEPVMEIGPVVPTGQGNRPIGWQDIAGWQDATSDTLTPWEAQAVIQLSDTYLSQHYASISQEAVAPWADTSAANHRALAERRRRRHKHG